MQMTHRAVNTGDDDHVPPEIARQIDENLKHLYGATGAADDLPDDLRKLIDALRAGEVVSPTRAEGK